MASEIQHTPHTISISPLLKRLAYPSAAETQVDASEIAAAFALVFDNRLSPIQAAALLTLLCSTRKDKDPAVVAQCSARMRDAAQSIEKTPLHRAVKAKGLQMGRYQGGLCDIVGTGGDSHSTFNISTTASIIASPLLVTAKHGNRAQSSLSGSADVLNAIAPVPPKLSAVTADNLAQIYTQTNYAFLFAPNFHPGMRHAASVRKELGIRTIFNLLGPLANPVDWAIEARVVGVAYQELGPVFAAALRFSGVRKALVVCGSEDLDEISCASPTNCWMLSESGEQETSDLQIGMQNNDNNQYHNDAYETSSRTSVRIETFQLSPSDFGLPAHPLSDVGGGKLPHENASKLMQILRNDPPSPAPTPTTASRTTENPILDFVLMNTAALLVISGVCEDDAPSMGPEGLIIKERGPGGQRWKEGVRKARWCIESGKALEQLQTFIEATNSV